LKAYYDFAHSSKEWHDNLKELKTFCRFIGSVCFSSWGKWCRPTVYIWCPCWGYEFSYSWRP